MCSRVERRTAQTRPSQSARVMRRILTTPGGWKEGWAYYSPKAVGKQAQHKAPEVFPPPRRAPPLSPGSRDVSRGVIRKTFGVFPTVAAGQRDPLGVTACRRGQWVDVGCE